MNFCELLKEDTRPLGMYGIKIPRKVLRTLAKRQFGNYLQGRVNWVEDAVFVVVSAILSPDAKVSDYLGLKYPETLPLEQRITDTHGERKTLLYRIRYLLKSIEIILTHDDVIEDVFQFEHVSGLAQVLDIFIFCLRQSVGVAATKEFADVHRRLMDLWSRVDNEIGDAEHVKQTLRALSDDLVVAFDELREAYRAVERQRTAAATEKSALAQALSELRDEQATGNRIGRATLNRVNRLAAHPHEPEDPYSVYAGLDRCNAAEREMLTACFRYSHEKFSVVRGKGAGHTLQQLANVVWRLNRERFEALAARKEAPGYRSAASLGTKLYKLATKYPEADHFRWA